MMLLVQALQPRCEIDRIPQNRVFHFIRRTDVADDREARMQASAGFKLAWRGDNFSGAEHRAAGMVARRRTLVFIRENGKNPVSDKLVYMAVMLQDDRY